MKQTKMVLIAGALMTALGACQTTASNSPANTALPDDGQRVILMSSSPYSPKDIIEGAASERSLSVPANLFVPERASPDNTVGALVYMHGSGGPRPRHLRTLEAARDVGFATVQVDSFTTRGVTSSVGDQTSVTAASMTMDAFAALELLAGDPRIDESRIYIMGSSKGGGPTYLTAWEPVRAAAAGDLRFAGHIALYPSCYVFDDAAFTDAPMLVMVAGNEDWTATPEQCVDMVQTINAQGYDNWSLEIYENAHHGFDREGGGVTRVRGATSFLDCIWGLTEDGLFYEANSGKVFTSPDTGAPWPECYSTGTTPTVGANKAATQKMRQDLQRFLTDTEAGA